MARASVLSSGWPWIAPSIGLRLDEIRKMAYDENAYRGPMDLGILLAIIFLFLYGLIYFTAP